MNGRVLLYGSTGRSGRLLAAALADLDGRLVLGGRSAGELYELAERLGLEARVLPADGDLTGGLDDIGLVVNAAGPFARTAASAITACLDRRVDYMDLAGEWPVFADALSRDAAAIQRDVMLLPGVGFAILVSDGVLALAARTSGEPAVGLRLGLSRPHALSAGSRATLWALNDPAVRIRRRGVLERHPAGSLSHAFDFGEGLTRAVAISWPDIVTIERSTGVPSLEVYSAVGWAGELAIRAAAWAAPALAELAGGAASGDDMAERCAPIAGDDMILVVEAEDRWRRARRLRFRTGDGYTTTTICAAAAVRAWAGGARRPGFQTPSGLFGPDFVLHSGAVTPIL